MQVAALHESTWGDSANREVVVGADATEARLVSGMKGARVIHIATHGFAFVDMDTGKSESGLVCAAAGTEVCDDGRLDDGDASWMNLDAVDLIVLSACVSGMGVQTTGEGLVGIRRSLRIAGARAVVSTLARIPDEATAELMTQFYERMWKKGESVSQAMRATKLSLLHRSRNENAHDERLMVWGAFVLDAWPE